MGLFTKSKPKEDKKKLDKPKNQLLAEGPNGIHRSAEKDRLNPEDQNKKQQQRTKSSESLKVSSVYHTQRNEQESTKEMSQEGAQHLESILSENKAIKNTVIEIKGKLDAIQGETEHIPRLSENLDDLRRELKTRLQYTLQARFEESKYSLFLQSIEDDAYQLYESIWIIHSLFEKTKKNEWIPLLWKRAFKSFDQIDKRPHYLKLLSTCFPTQSPQPIDTNWVICGKKIGRVILQNKYDSIPDGVRIFETREPVPISHGAKQSREIASAGQDTKQSKGLATNNHNMKQSDDLESGASSKQKTGKYIKRSDANLRETIQNKISRESLSSNRSSIHEIGELQREREMQGIPKRISSLAPYLNENVISQLKDDGH